MMHPSSEHTPLLGGIDRRNNNGIASSTTTRRRPSHITSARTKDEDDDNDENDNNDDDAKTESMYSQVGASGSNRQNHSHRPSEHISAYKDHVPSGDTDFQGKADRRSWAKRFLGNINRKVTTVTYNVLPPVADERSYEDTFNDQPWRWTFGTHEDDGVWMNTTDRAGTIMALMVWVLILYSIFTMLLLSTQRHIPIYSAAIYSTICTLALASHAKTTFTDPGAVSSSSVPLVTKGIKFHPMCSLCQCYKPKYAHHCRICNRCVTRMDHHCPWMNNCVGAGNLKHFTLFLLYTWLGSAMALSIFTINYFFCSSSNCEFNRLEIQLVRFMSLICLSALLFTSSMIMSVVYGVITGVGTIDRLKKKATGTWHLSDDEAIPLSHVFGSGPAWTWFLPTDPFFPDYDQVMGYATTQRLLREQSMEVTKQRQRISSSRRMEV